MLQSFEAVYDHGRLDWLADAPASQGRMRVIVTIVQELADDVRQENFSPPELVGKMRILCDEQTLMEPVVGEDDWDALR